MLHFIPSEFGRGKEEAQRVVEELKDKAVPVKMMMDVEYNKIWQAAMFYSVNYDIMSISYTTISAVYYM